MLACLPPFPTEAVLRVQYNADILVGYFGADLLPPVRFDLALSGVNDRMTWFAGMQIGGNVHPSATGNAAMLARVKLDLPGGLE